jgi:hypothetical protein
MFKSGEEKAQAAAEIAATDAFLRELAELPQFIEIGVSLLHGLSGCKVTAKGDEIILAWSDTYAGGDGRVERLPKSMRDKYMALMKAQAATLAAAADVD